MQNGYEDDEAEVVEGGNLNLFEDYDDGFGADNGGSIDDYDYDYGETGGFRYPSRRGNA